MTRSPQPPRSNSVKTAFRWQPNAGLVVFVLIFLPITVSLGFWQLARADEKRALLAAYDARQAAEPISMDAVPESADNQYRRIKETGSFDNQQTLMLDNRIRRGQPGYEVISLFKPINGDQWLPVNRGWLAGGLDRSRLPEVPAIEGQVTVFGKLYRSPGAAFTLGSENWAGNWPLVVQNLMTDELAAATGLAIYPWQLRLDQASPGALMTGWPVVSTQPGKHIGYAVQWFALALALLILALFANSNLGSILSRK